MRKKKEKPIEDEKKELLSLYSTIKCDFCDMEINFGEQWIHISRHQQGLGQLVSSNCKFDINSVRLPWYMHSIYQDRTVNRSRYEVMQLTELTRDSQYYAMEKQIKKPFTTHFWLNYNMKPTGDAIKDFFGLSPYTIDYTVFDSYHLSHIRDGKATQSSTSVDCNFCRHRVHKCTTLIQTIVATLVHALAEHSDNQQLYNACLTDLDAIQEATGIQMRLKQLPEYQPLIMHDLLFDFYYSRDTFVFVSSMSVLGTYCMLCFKLIGTMKPHDMKVHFDKEHKSTKIVQALASFDCISAARYGHSTSIGCKNHVFPYMLVENEDKSEFSWACYKCNVVLKHSDAMQLIMYVAAHLSTGLGFCQTQGFFVGTKNEQRMLIYELIQELFAPCKERKRVIGSWNTQLKPLTPDDVKEQFLRLSLRDFLDKWLFQVKPDVTGHVALCADFDEFKPKYYSNGKRVIEKRADGCIYVCPYCFSYFTNKYTVFLHLQPNECPQMLLFKLTLDPKALKRAARKSPKMIEPFW